MSLAVVYRIELRHDGGEKISIAKVAQKVNEEFGRTCTTF